MADKDAHPADLARLMTDDQLAQMHQLLAELLTQGVGRLEIVIENRRLRWMVPHQRIVRPGLQPRFEAPALLAEPWFPEIAAGLQRVQKAGWGSITIFVEYGVVSGIDVAPSIPADSGRRARVPAIA
jgi:hypothetical protein